MACWWMEWECVHKKFFWNALVLPKTPHTITFSSPFPWLSTFVPCALRSSLSLACFHSLSLSRWQILRRAVKISLFLAKDACFDVELERGVPIEIRVWRLGFTALWKQWTKVIYWLRDFHILQPTATCKFEYLYVFKNSYSLKIFDDA